MEKIAKQYQENLKKVRAENSSLLKVHALMKKYGVNSSEMAFSIEAKKMMEF